MVLEDSTGGMPVVGLIEWTTVTDIRPDLEYEILDEDGSDLAVEVVVEYGGIDASYLQFVLRSSWSAAGEQCVICLEVITQEQISAEQTWYGRCFHRFHTECISPVIYGGSNECPVCRTMLTTPDERDEANAPPSSPASESDSEAEIDDVPPPFGCEIG